MVLVIRATSSGFSGDAFAQITVNNFPVNLQKSSEANAPGLHIVVINPLNGDIEFAKVFDTSKSSKEFDEFVTSGCKEGYIIVATCEDDCTRQLS